jgi:MFS family permease
MNPTSNPIAIGIIAGLAAAILMAGAAYISLFSILLMIAAIASIFVAGMGFGAVSGIVAVVVASLASAALAGNPTAFVAMAVQLSPAVVMSYLANLARPADELGGPKAAMAWFPLSDIMLAGAVVSAIATSGVLLLHPDLEAAYGLLADLVLELATRTNPDVAFDVTRDELMRYLEVLFPLTQGWQMMIALFGGFYFAMRVLGAARRNIRPREDIPASLRMNRLSIAVFFAGLALMFAGSGIEVIGASFVGAVAGGYLLAGFAIVHNMLRNKSYRLPALVLVYLVSLIVWPLAFIIFLAGGLANPRRAIALTPHESNENPENQN